MQGGRLIGATCGIIEEKNHGWALIRAWALNRDNTVIETMNIVIYRYLRLRECPDKCTFDS